ncbi:MAG TPA: leucine-rich repeat protein [Phycisphaerae bacterium]|nr:leucine-rich repeat protein [Phycisphaerae bacterium]
MPARARDDLGTDCYDCGPRDVGDEEPDSGQVVSFSDRCLEDAVRRAISKDTGDITIGDLASLTSLTASRVGIANLSGLEYCTNLEYLDLVDNDIVDLGPLAGLTKLKTLHLGNNLIVNISLLADLPALEVLTLIANQVSDLGALQGMTSLLSLNVSYQLDMQIPESVEAQQPPGFVYADHTILSDISKLAGLTGLTELRLSGNRISDISPLAGLTELRTLGLAENRFTGLTPLQGLPNLKTVFLNQNPITDLSPLAGNTSLGEGTTLYMNCCSPDFDCDGLSTSVTQCGYVSDLEARGVSVNAGYDSKRDDEGNVVPDVESCAVMPPILGLGSGTCDAS